MDVLALEGLAELTLREICFEDPPIDMIDVASLLELDVRYTSGESRFERGEILVSTKISTKRFHAAIAHEVAHLLMREAKIEDDEKSAGYLGAALLVPRRALDRQLRAGWDLQRLLALHLNASAELLARRIVDVRHAALAIYDQGRLRRRVGHREMSPAIERELAVEAFETGAPVRVDDCIGAWPIFDGAWRRVLVLSA